MLVAVTHGQEIDVIAGLGRSNKDGRRRREVAIGHGPSTAFTTSDTNDLIEGRERSPGPAADRGPPVAAVSAMTAEDLNRHSPRNRARPGTAPLAHKARTIGHAADGLRHVMAASAWPSRRKSTKPTAVLPPDILPSISERSPRVQPRNSAEHAELFLLLKHPYRPVASATARSTFLVVRSTRPEDHPNKIERTLNVGSSVATSRLMPSEQLAVQERRSRVRVIDALVGGKDNYIEDRNVAAKIAQVLPGGFEGAKRLFTEDFWFRVRVCRMLISRGAVSHFVLLGVDQCETSAAPLHGLIHRDAPDAVVVYVEPELDSATLALEFDTRTKGRGPVVRVVHDDIYDPALLTRLFESSSVPLDASEPVALLHCATLPFLPSSSGVTPAEVTAGQIDTLPEGSFVAVSHLCIPGGAADSAAAVRAANVLEESFGTRLCRPEAEIATFFGGLPLVVPSPLTSQPALVSCSKWYPPGPLLERFAVDEYNVGAVAHKGKPWPFA
ncbi:SAM-dependent methyltransferase [Amycolatopsis sp. TNS106]|uniref:SAM-dependent methyltransferase n=1 Tax=Amycolatopsis sp. TNS106 TaxID=2861750 RepID=UPI001C5902C0|nr:SAM-dependent methyltransferase [Amycolatopsis sp. TNS106]